MKIAFLIDSFILPQWKYKIIEDFYNNESTELQLIKIKANNFIQKLSGILYYLYEALDYLVFSKTNKFKETQSEKDALKKINIKSLNIRHCECSEAIHSPDNLEWIASSHPQDASRNDQQIISENKFDLIIDLTKTFKKDFYSNFNAMSKKGICFFEFGDESNLYPPFFKEIYFNIPSINVSLSLTDGKYKKTLYKSCSAANNISLYLNNNKNLWKMSEFINRIIDDINNYPASVFNPEDECLRYDIKIPPNSLMIKFISKILKNLIKTKISGSKFKNQWFLAYRKIQENMDKLNYEIISPPEDKFFADPFIINENGKSYIFFEECCFSDPKGVISYFEINENGEISPPKTVLEKDHHLSYPFVFKYENKYYMIPETLANKTIELYEAIKFPEEWQLNKILFNNVHAVDTSLLFHNDKFWLFTNMSANGSSLSDELFLFYSDSLFGEWKSHPKNPIISNTKTARSAGKLFFYENKLIRPSQENSVRYGYALNFNSVDILNEDEYKETLIKNIPPHFIKDNLAVHTFNSDNTYNIIDGMRLIEK